MSDNWGEKFMDELSKRRINKLIARITEEKENEHAFNIAFIPVVPLPGRDKSCKFNCGAGDCIVIAAYDMDGNGVNYQGVSEQGKLLALKEFAKGELLVNKWYWMELYWATTLPREEKIK